MKQVLTWIGALAVAAAIIAGIAIFVKKYTVKFSIEKNEEKPDDVLPDELEAEPDISWEDVPVEEDDTVGIDPLSFGDPATEG